MFLERAASRAQRKGWIEVVCGSMFSGKTEELIRRMRRAEFARQRVEIFKPGVDTRYDAQDVVSHDRNSIRSTPVPNSSNLLLLAGDIEVVGIDEAQFFDAGLPQVCEQLASQGVRVIAAGLDMDFLGRPFGPMPQLMAMAEYVTKVHAICMRCGELATFSHRTSTSRELVVLGETDQYEPLCRTCFFAARAEMEPGT
ncbi:MAG: thymidine kinase [Bacteroidetes bacterium]|jgi:thymidine kinase|nr:thymidine kinase [Bacteroidota bacterium]MCC6655226.1 thymidine kinase [Flavobacteriales bacterium]HMU12427.1 thymidine kinase [Flavobacteriales bacterium]HRT52597.1 thymidine kinase [Flavobacteriales bacterium]